MKKFAAVLTVLCLLMSCSAAMAASVTVNGKVVATQTETITAPIAGTVKKVQVTAGTHVASGASLMTFATTVVYAQEAGTVRIFGSAGEQTSSVANKYGAVAYVEPDSAYTISASTKYAYDNEANRVVHPGETVYLKSYTDAKSTGTGKVTQVSGTSFKVEITKGSFSTGESVMIFRRNSYAATTRIGRGPVSHADPVAYTGEGSIVKFSVKNGAAVKKGDALFETLNGEFEGLSVNSSKVTSTVDGIVASVSVTAGATIEKGAVVAEIYPDSAMRIEASVSEADLRYLPVGSSVTVEFPYLQEETVSVTGKVQKISYLADETTTTTSEDGETTDEAYYKVYISFSNVENVRYGMRAIITSKD